MVERVGLADAARRAADDQSELDLVVRLRLRARDHDRLSRSDHRARQLGEKEGLLRENRVRVLLLVARVVDPGAEDLPGARDRGEDPLRLDGVAAFGSFVRAFEAAFAVTDQLHEVGVAGGNDATVAPDADRLLAAGEV